MTSNNLTVRKPERIISLAMYLTERSLPYATYDDLAENVEGYEGLISKDESTIKRLNRDIESLKELGIFVNATNYYGELRFSIDHKRSFVDEVSLSPYEVLRLRLASMTPLHDPSFMFPDELGSAVTKLSGFLGGTTELNLTPVDRLSVVDEKERSLVRKIDTTRKARKELTFTYVSSQGIESERRVRPYGMFAIGRDWYLIAYDLERKGMREFRVDRMDTLAQANDSQAPDFDIPDFDVRTYIDFPFKYGVAEPFRVVFLLPRDIIREPSYLWEKASVFHLDDMPDHLVMSSTARSVELAARWAIEYAPGIIPVYPQEVRDAFLSGLERTEACHG